MKKYDVIIVGAGPGGIFSAYELVTNNSEIKVAVFEKVIFLKRENVRLTVTKLKLHFMQNLFHYERFRRCGCIFGR